MTPPQLPLFKRAVSEGLGTALLVAAVIGSGIMGEQLAQGNTAIALLANTIATGTALLTLILTFGPLSGAHFNPAVTLAVAVRRVFPWREAIPYIAAQLLGGLLGTLLAHVMFGRHWYSLSQHPRSGWPQLIRTPRAPQRRGNTLIEHPANRQVNNALAETLPGEPIQPLHGGHILCEPRLAEFRIAAPKIVAIEDRVRRHASG